MVVWQELALEFSDPELINAAALAAWEGGLVERAEELFLEALKTRPDNVDALFGLGMLLEELNRLGEARSFLLAGLELEQRAPMLTILGSVQWRLGDNDAAQVAYRRSLELSPKDAEAHHGFGLTLIPERPLEAAEQFQLALDIDLALPYSQREMGHAFWKAGKYQEAEEACRQAIVQNPDDSWGHDYLGHLLLIRDALDEGVPPRLSRRIFTRWHVTLPVDWQISNTENY
jgi:tetratricopeptide (TPR) repeat protein